ncbi:MAG: efflux RND transporter periplasmic adaptor subunit [Acidobacteriota bacterium]|jgi:RND family efflux transporter MFP subunit
MRHPVRNLAVLLVLGGIATLAMAHWLSRADDDRDVAEVRREEFRSIVEATGKLEAAVAYEIGPPSVAEFWNYSLTWMIPEGKRVQKGEPIARFDTTDIDDRLRDHRAKLETAIQEREKEERNLEVSLRQLRLDLVKAEAELKEVDLDLSVPEELLPEIEVEQNRLRKQLAERRVAFLGEKIEFEKDLVRSKLELLDVKREFSEGKIAYYEAARDRFTVKAPVSGVVVYVPKRNGDRWEVGESVWMLAKILKVADVSTLRVEAAVLEVDSARIQVGQPGEIAIDALPGTALRSRVSEIGRIVHERSVQDPSKVFDAMLPLEAADLEDLRPGMGVHVEIETERFADRLTIPLGAVRVAGGDTYVEVLGPGSGPERRPVELGPRNAERVVVESGLQAGERVLLRGAGA